MVVMTLLSVVRVESKVIFLQLFVALLQNHLLGMRQIFEARHSVRHEIHFQHLFFLLHHKPFHGYVLDKMEDKIRPVLPIEDNNLYVGAMIVELCLMANILLQLLRFL
jgi:hypothetical protein